MQIKRLGPAFLIAFLPGLASAQMRYTSFEIDFVDIDFGDDLVDVSGDGFELHGSYALGENWFVFGQYQDQNVDYGADGSSLEAGVGYHLPLRPNVDFIAAASFIDAEVGRGQSSVDDQALAIAAGARAHLGKAFEVEGGVKYVNFDDSGSDTSWVVTGRYYFTERFAVTAGTDLSDHADTFRLGFRGEF